MLGSNGTSQRTSRKGVTGTGGPRTSDMSSAIALDSDPDTEDEAVSVLKSKVETVSKRRNVSYEIIQNLEWVELNPSIPLSGRSMVSRSSDIYLFGSDSFSSLDPRLEDRQCGVTPVPVPKRSVPLAPRLGSKSLIFENYVYTFGGSSASTGEFHNDMHIYSIASRSWSTSSLTGKVPCGRSDFTFTLFGEKFLLFGGRTKTRILNDVWQYSPVANKWERFRTDICPSGRLGHSAGQATDGVLVFGGWDGKHYLSDLWCYSVGGWKRVVVSGKSPTGRYRHSAVTYEGKMYIFGGTDGRNQYLSDIHVFSYDSCSWSSPIIPSGSLHPSGRINHESIITPSGVMIVFGGNAGRDVIHTDMWAIDLAAKPTTTKLQRRISELESRITCKVCMTSEISCVLLPCAHRCMCLSCATVIVNTSDCLCPICRQTILRLIPTLDP